MKPLHLSKSKDTPEIILDPDTGILTITGESYPENAFEYYKPVLSWLQEFAQRKQDAIVVNFKLQYFNSSSSKCLLDVLEILEEFHQGGGTVTVNWYYQKDDVDIEESGENFSEDFSFGFNIIECS